MILVLIEIESSQKSRTSALATLFKPVSAAGPDFVLESYNRPAFDSRPCFKAAHPCAHHISPSSLSSSSFSQRVLEGHTSIQGAPPRDRLGACSRGPDQVWFPPGCRSQRQHRGGPGSVASPPRKPLPKSHLPGLISSSLPLELTFIISYKTS